MQKLLLCLLVPVIAAVGQTTPNSVTVTATSTPVLQPDQVVFNLLVDTGPSASQDDAFAALEGSGARSTDFTGVRSFLTDGPQVLEWSFNLTVPLSSLQATLGLLGALQTNAAKKGNGVSLAYSIQGTQISAQLAQSKPCVWADLISDARGQAARLAAGAGLGVGSILSVASSSMSNLTQGIAAGSFGNVGAPTAAPTCALVVKFALTGL